MPDLDSIDTAIQRSLARGDTERARQVSCALDDFSPATLQECRTAADLLLKVGRTGWAEVAIIRYIEKAPSDREAVLYLIEFRIKNGANVDSLVRQFEAKGPHEELLLGKFFSRIKKHEDAIAAFRSVLHQQPSNIEAHRGLIQNLNWIKRHAVARKAIINFLKVMPADAACWAFVAENALTAGDTKLFLRASMETEQRLSENDNHSRSVIANAYSAFGDFDSVDRVISGFPINKLQSDLILSKIITLSARHNLPHHLIAAARRVTELDKMPGKLIVDANRIILRFNEHGAAGLWSELES